MSAFNLKAVMEKYGLKKRDIAPIFFPDNAFGYHAVDRMMKVGAPINTDQVERLAAYLCVPVSDLFTEGWTTGCEDGILTLKKGPWLAKLNYNGAFLTILHEGRVVNQIVTDSYRMKISEFLRFIDSHVNNLSLT